METQPPHRESEHLMGGGTGIGAEGGLEAVEGTLVKGNVRKSR